MPVIALYVCGKQHADEIEKIDDTCHEPVGYEFTDVGPIHLRFTRPEPGGEDWYLRGKLMGPGSPYGRPWQITYRAGGYELETSPVVLQKGVPVQVWKGNFPYGFGLVITGSSYGAPYDTRTGPEGDPNALVIHADTAGFYSPPGYPNYSWSGQAAAPITCIG